MSSTVLERLNKRFHALRAEVDAVAATASEVDTIRQECAAAMEAAYGDAARKCEAGLEAAQEAAIQQGMELERQRTLLLISLVGEGAKEGGAGAQALAKLRRMVLKEEGEGLS